MKTVLAPNAPWPVQVEVKPKPIKRVKKVMPKPNHGKRKLVDANFERWLSTIPPLKTKGNNNA
jgi:hypothetical protein